MALRQLVLTEEQVKGLLSAGRVERGPTELCDVHQILGDVARLVDPACQHANVVLCQPPRDEAPAIEIMVDRSSLRAAILNLTLNAIEAAGQGGTVSLDAYSQNTEVSIEVVDSGPGPPPELADVSVRAVRHDQTRGCRAWPGARAPRRPRPPGQALVDAIGRGDSLYPETSLGQWDSARSTHEPHSGRR